ncbi:MAG: type II secretion system protein GspF [Candidatus Muproteobacteria bacterium RBG_16_65_34]|uniref:Type II secretion system protein GspF n=1 Tax=Candidatus Muproteobacteria bacterium RBG_16_65_34 TaxID=1817760 RepID=A0A1F6TPZ0_9PROT|nr:MAG: type II secretion system protein GspF [Candidatus Muproteobacteria bacterium RBG_16_65_34]
MAAYEYLALDVQGRTVKGVVEGDAERAVRARLREQGLTPMEVTPIAEGATPTQGAGLRSLRRGISGAELALLTRQFATLVRAGLTIEACLNALIEQSESARARAVLAGVRARVREGQSLARAMGLFPNAFPELYRHLIDAGEQSGKLDEVLERLADYTETRQALKQKVVLAFIYPALVTAVALTVVTGLIVYVVPQVTRVFVNTGQQLPLLTRILIALSDFVRQNGLVFVAAAVAASIGARFALRNPAVRARWQAFLLRLPLWGRLTRSLNAERLARTLGILVTSGIPLLKAMQAAVLVVSNLPMRAAAEEALKQVREGGSLSRALAKSGYYPPIMVHLIASGEASGQLDVMLLRVAESQTRELEHWVATLTALLEPILILVMGAVVLFIVLAILLPIFEMNQLIK